MDLGKLRFGEVVAGASGALLLAVMSTTWFSFENADDARRQLEAAQDDRLLGRELSAVAERAIDAGERNAWEAFTVIDLFLAFAALMALALVVVTVTQRGVAIPVAAGSLTTLVAVFATLLVLFRLLFVPEAEFGDLSLGGQQPDVESTRALGVYLGLLATAGIAAGGWLSMRDEGFGLRPGPGIEATQPELVER